MDIKEFRQKYPQYGSLSDQDLAQKLHAKHYSNMEFADFSAKFGVSTNEQPSVARGTAREALQGATFGFSDELGAGAAAAAVRVSQMLGINPETDESFGQIYRNIHESLKGEREQFREENPALAAGAQIAGALTTGGLGGAKALSAIPQASRAARTATAAGVGAVEGGLFGAGTADPGERAEGAAKGAAIGAVVTPAVTGLANAVRSTLTKRGVRKAVEKAIPDREQVKAAAQAAFREAEDLGVSIAPQSYQNLTGQLSAIARNSGFNARIHPKVNAALDSFGDLAEKTPTLGEMEIQRRILKSAAGSMEADERRIANKLIGRLDDYMSNLKADDVASGAAEAAGDTLKKARGLWAKNAKADMIEEAIEKAQNQATGFENGLRVQFRALLNNKKKMRGFTQEEKDAMRKVVRGGPMENTLKFLGRFGFGEGQATSTLGASIGVGAGASLGGVPGAIAVPLIGQAARKASQTMTRKNAETVQKIILGGASPARMTSQYLKQAGRNASPEELAQILTTASPQELARLSARVQNFTGKNRQLVSDALSIVTAQSAAQ